MTPLSQLLKTYREISQSEREKGSYFEELIRCYLQHEASYRELYREVWYYPEWARQHGYDARDSGIDLVAQTQSGDYHAIQCKLYAEDYTLQKKDIDSFFTASGKKPFVYRLIVSTTTHWSNHATEALRDQQPPVSKIDLYDLENSQIDWARYQLRQQPVLKAKKSIRPHQRSAHDKVVAGLKTAERGKLIMACGTGKTFTSLKIAETIAGRGGSVLFLVPSLALLSQILTEWTQESSIALHSFAVCSDSDVGKRRKKIEDSVQTFTHELRYPATTNAASLAREFIKQHDEQHLSVVFSTYHSLAVINRAQQEHHLPIFDLIICDEAHRTTGAIFENDDESTFVKVHDNQFVSATKRLYMTATPRIYGDSAKITAELSKITLCSMDDAALYGKELHMINFSEAVKRDLLVDYKVIVLAVSEDHINQRLQSLLTDDNNQLKMSDAARIIGCWKALAKHDLTIDLAENPTPMQRAVAFCQVIERSKDNKVHKVSSKQIARMFQEVVATYQQSEDQTKNNIKDPLNKVHGDSRNSGKLSCEADHVDGTMNASVKEQKIAWLKDITAPQVCRILSNVRCLSEGVDVPALDAVLFLSPRNSQVEVVQSVGRVMRKDPEGKKQRGYVILPVVIPSGIEPHEALNDNKTYAVVWQVLQALRSHDDTFDAMINKLELIGKHTSKIEVVTIVDRIQKKSAPPRQKSAKADKKLNTAGFTIGTAAPVTAANLAVKHYDIQYEVGEIERAIYAKLVQKVGNRHHWEDWANDIATIARRHISRITGILANPFHEKEINAFQQFALALRSDINNQISDSEIVEMLAQHLITQPVFEALFTNYSFVAHNPVSQAMRGLLDTLHEHHLEKEADTLQAFYESVKLRAEGIDNAAGKQKIVLELYDKFFRNAFPKLTERLGIVYTPIEVVDFIIYSVNHLLKQEFNKTLGSPDVHIIDPFTGTGTFITRLLQSGLITNEQLPLKYYYEIHANEIVLLAYYIAAINIETTYHELIGGDYQPFNGICLTDTFQLHEPVDLVDMLLADNSERCQRQKKLNIRVIIGNPPYSAGQGSANDNNQNLNYPALDQKIRDTYAARSIAINKKSLYDSYIRAIRWASDRIGNSGIIGFVTNAGFLDSNTADGLRQCLAEDFSSIHIFNLRGDIRKNMLSKGRTQEGQNIFGSNSMTGIAITFFVKNLQASHPCQINYFNIGDDLTREEKFEKLINFNSIAHVNWQHITPDAHGDWLNQRDDSFSEFIVLGNKKDDSTLKLFANYSNGLVTNRDAWCYNTSKIKLAENIQRMINFYNREVERFGNSQKKNDAVGDFVNNDPTKISWTRSLKQELSKKRTFFFDIEKLTPSLYRPFTKQWLYFDRRFNEMVYQMPRIFPDATAENLVICVTGIGANGFSCLMANNIPDLQTLENGQCFPLYLYEEKEVKDNEDLFSSQERTRREAITEEGLQHFQEAYPHEIIKKDDIFYYVYGLLHSPQYREKYAANLIKELPRIPCVNGAKNFWEFSKAGRTLADLHLSYETVAMYPAEIVGGGNYRVEKMRYGKDKDKTTIHYNELIIISGIPLEAYEYVVNGKAAIDWVVERQGIRTDKDSGIINDANDWARDTMANPRYPLELLLRVITVSLETMKIIKQIPEFEVI